MNKIAIRVVFSAIMCGLFIQPAFALDLLWLNQSPSRFFTDDDWDLAQEAATKALDTAKDGETVSWKSPTSDTNGSFTPLSTTTRDGATCRRVKTANHARNLDGGSVMNFCQQPDGEWRLVADDRRR
jgi:surface antigen